MAPNQSGGCGVYTSVTASLEAFLETSYDRAFRTACLILRNPADAEEAVQEAFLRAWRFKDAVKSESLGPWLYRVLVNTCYSKARARKQIDGDAALAGEASRGADPEVAAIASDTAAQVRSALQSLSEPLRVVIVLRYFAGLSEREIATVIRRRPGTVKSRLHAARRQLGAHPSLVSIAEEGAQ